jgi:membrane protease subunit HflC
MTRRIWIGAGLAVLGLMTIWSTLYTVSETEQVVITQFGEPIGRAVTQPGLHVKVPFAQEVNVFDKRWLEWDGNANQVPTRDKKYIWVDTYARWRIRCCFFSGCATSTGPSRVWTTSSTVRRAT